MKKLLFTLLTVFNLALAAPTPGPNAPDDFYCQPTEDKGLCISNEGGTNWILSSTDSRSTGINIFGGCYFSSATPTVKPQIVCNYFNQTTHFLIQASSVDHMHPNVTSPLSTWSAAKPPYSNAFCQITYPFDNTFCPWALD